MEMGKMVTKRLTKDQHIFQVYDYKAVEKVKKRLIHQTLKGRGGVEQSKGYNNPFEEVKMHKECIVRLKHWYNLDFVIPWAKSIFENHLA